MLIKSYEPGAESPDEYILRVFNNIIENKCNICYIGLESIKKDSFLKKLLLNYGEAVLINSHFETTSNSILNARANQKSVIFNLVAYNELCALDILTSRLVFQESMNDKEANKAVFKNIDYIISFDYKKECIVKISEINSQNQTINPIITYDYITNEFK